MDPTGEGIPLRVRVQNFDTTFKIYIASEKEAPGFSCYTVTVIELFKKPSNPYRVKSFSHFIESNNALIVVLQ